MLPNNLYDILSKIQRFLPALGVFYLAIAQISQPKGGSHAKQQDLRYGVNT